MYPIGASNQTYSTFPSEPSTGTFTPQSRSRVIARGCNPWFIHDMHCPFTLGFHSGCDSIYSFSQGDSSSSGRNQFFVFLSDGFSPLSVDLGLIRSVGLSVEP